MSSAEQYYLDTSAAAKLLVQESESAALAEWADAVELVSSVLLETELRRLAVRTGIPQADVTAVLDRVPLYEVAPSLFHEAGVLPGANLRSLDALHLAVALRLRVNAVVTYDARMAQSARDLGLTVLMPGVEN